MRGVSNVTCSSSTVISEPISCSSRSIVRISRTRGTRFRTTFSPVSSAAASAGRAEFFEPLVGIVPLSRTPPSMTSLSIQLIVVYQCVYGRAHIVIRGAKCSQSLIETQTSRRLNNPNRPIQQLRVLRLHIHHQIPAHITQPNERPRSQHVQHKL